MINNIEDLNKKINCGIFNCVGLSINDRQIIARNVKKTDFDKNINEIIQYLSSPYTEEGLYTIFHSVQYRNKPEITQFLKGKEKKLMNEQNKPLIYSVDSAIEKDVRYYTYIIEDLKNKIADLEDENEILIEQIETLKNEKTNLSEVPPESEFKSILSEVLSAGLPLLDKYFELQKEKNIILSNQQRPKLKPNKSVIEQKIEKFINQKINEPETFNKLTAIYYNSNNIQQFAEKLKENDEQLYNECRTAINS